MSIQGDDRIGSTGINVSEREPTSPTVSQASIQTPEFIGASNSEEPVDTKFATRAVRTADSMSKGKLALLGGALLLAVLFFVYTATVNKSPKKRDTMVNSSQQAKQESPKQSKGSVTPLMDTVRTPAPDNTSDQLGPNDIRRTRSQDKYTTVKPTATRTPAVVSLGGVPSFGDTQQKWVDPAPYGTSPTPEALQNQQNSLKEPSLVFVRSVVQNQIPSSPKPSTAEDGPQLRFTPGTRIQAKLETEISSAVSAPVVAVVEYTYAIGDRVVVPAGARVYGQLQQADRSGLVSVKFDEIELLDGAREKIEAVGAALDLGPIKGNVYGKNTGKNFLVRAASGLGSVLAEVAGNNTSGAFSEDDMLRERLAENIGTAGDSEVMNLNSNTRVVVSVPADTKIYVVFINHEQPPAGLHKVTTSAQ